MTQVKCILSVCISLISLFKGYKVWRDQAVGMEGQTKVSIKQYEPSTIVRL